MPEANHHDSKEEDTSKKEACWLSKRAVRYAINHLTERQSIMTEQELTDCALKQGTGLIRIEDRKQTLILSGTNEARRDTTQAQRRYARTYHIGDIIQPEKDYPNSGLKHGCLYGIIDKGPGKSLMIVAL